MSGLIEKDNRKERGSISAGGSISAKQSKICQKWTPGPNLKEGPFLTKQTTSLFGFTKNICQIVQYPVCF